jgi:beta-glucanase (GH16 family)
MNSTCPSNPALGTNATFNFTGGAMGDSKIWKVTSGSIKWNEDGADFVVANRGDSPTIQSNFYMFFGICSVFLRAAPGTGIVSSIVLQSDDLDEVDWELIGGNKTHVQSNYFGKGNTTSFDRDVWHPVDNPMDRAINYTTHWTQEKLEWYIDEKLVRTLKYEDALNGYNFPQTPMNIRIGIWAGGDPENNSKGTVEWAGGETDFKKGPYTMTVESIYAQDFTSGKEYTYGDKTGSFKSIKVTE